MSDDNTLDIDEWSLEKLRKMAETDPFIAHYLSKPLGKSKQYEVTFAHFVDKIEVIGLSPGCTIEKMDQAIAASRRTQEWMVQHFLMLSVEYYRLLSYVNLYQKTGNFDEVAVVFNGWNDEAINTSRDTFLAFAHSMTDFMQKHNILEFYILDIPATEVGRKILQFLKELQEARRAYWKKLAAKRGYVYLVKSVSGYYKIGRARDIQRRVRRLEVKLPFEVELEHAFFGEDCFATEKALHARFASKRVKGEWFDLAEEDVTYIKSQVDWAPQGAAAV